MIGAAVTALLGEILPAGGLTPFDKEKAAITAHARARQLSYVAPVFPPDHSLCACLIQLTQYWNPQHRYIEIGLSASLDQFAQQARYINPLVYRPAACYMPP